MVCWERDRELRVEECWEVGGVGVEEARVKEWSGLGVGQSSLLSSHKGTNLIEDPTLMTSSPKGPTSQYQPLWDLGLQHMNLAGYQPSIHNTLLKNKNKRFTLYVL